MVCGSYSELEKILYVIKQEATLEQLHGPYFQCTTQGSGEGKGETPSLLYQSCLDAFPGQSKGTCFCVRYCFFLQHERCHEIIKFSERYRS